jgi:WD40 repeat protein
VILRKKGIIAIVLFLCCLSARDAASQSAEIFLQLGHSDSVYSVAFSPDGGTLASGSHDNTVKLWDVKDGELLGTLSGHSDWVSCVAFSPDGGILASGSTDNTVKLWDVRTGDVLRTLSGHSNYVYSVAFSPDGKTLASGSRDRTVKLWDVRTGDVLRTLSGRPSSVTSVAFSPDGGTLASGSMAFSFDVSTLASGSDDNTVKLWDVKGGKLSRTLSGHSSDSDVYSVAFSPDGKTLVFGSGDNTVKLWDVKDGELLGTLSGHSDHVISVAFSPDGSTLASGSRDSTVKLWDVRSGDVLRTLSGHSDYVRSVAFSPDGGTLASGSDDNTVKLWDVKDGKLSRTLSGHSGSVYSVAFSPDGSTLASGSTDNTVKLWDVRSGHVLGTLSGHSDPVYSVAFSSDGGTLASGSDDNTVKLWDVKGGKLSRTLSGHFYSVTPLLDLEGFLAYVDFDPGGSTLAFSPDGGALAFGSWDNTVKLWDVKGGELLRTLRGHSSDVISVAFSPDGGTLASGSDDSTVKLWDVRSGHVLRTLRGHSDYVRSVAFSPDGGTLASGSRDSTVKLWDVKGGEELRSLSGHSRYVSSVAFSPDGSMVASGSRDNTVKLWDIHSGEIKMSVVFLPGNEWLTYHPKRLVYNSSLQGDEYAAVRFDNQLRPVYPLEYYRDELKREEDLLLAFQSPQPEIKPKRLRRWWEYDLRPWWRRPESKALLVVGVLLVASAGFGATYVLRKRTDPLKVAKQFFARAGFEEVEASGDLLLLGTKGGQAAGMAILWREGEAESISGALRSHKEGLEGETKLYVVYEEQGPPSGVIHSLREELGCEVVPLLSSMLERTLAREEDCQRVLKELEEPYITRIDPYAESKPINDPNWFYGRDELLNRLPAVLAQGQHIGIFGLRKVGKTSLTNQLRQRFAETPTAFMDCQAFSARAEIYFQEIIGQLHAELRSHDVKGLPRLQGITDGEDFRQRFLDLFGLWEKSGRRERFLIILDEIDKLFPGLELRDSEEILAEYVRLFRVLRGLAQSRNCLVTLVIAYRPDVNRRNLLTPGVGENPMFGSYQEEYLGFLSPGDSEAMIREIGLWKQIVWDVDAAQRVFHYCGGHPLVTRLFASDACEAGALKDIDYGQVEETAREIQSTFRRNEIGNLYREGMWDLLSEDEQQALGLICQAGEEGLSEAEVSDELDGALANLERFGLVVGEDGKLRVCAQLFRTWLERRFGL